MPVKAAHDISGWPMCVWFLTLTIFVCLLVNSSYKMSTVKSRCSYLFCLIWAILGLTNGATNCIVQSDSNIDQIICNVTENVPEGTIVFNVTEIDSRYASNLRYVIHFSLDDTRKHFRQHFDINTMFAPSTLRNGLIRTRGDFDREDMFLSSGNSREQITWSLFLVVSVPEPALYRLLINVVDINDNIPTFLSAMYHISGVEGDQQNANLNEYIIAARDTDQEHNAVQEYFLEDDLEGLFTLSVTLVGDIDTRFSVNEDVVRLESTRPLDREERASYNLVMIARDGGNMTGRLNINLTVLDVNDNDPVVAKTSYIVYIKENSTAIQHVIDINATDMDSGINGALTYSFSEITGDNEERVSGDIFSINASTGDVRTNAVLDREVDSSYCLIVQVKDRGSPPRSIFVTVDVEIYDNLDDGLINGATNCILQSGGNIKQIICNVTENVPKGTIVFNVTEIDSRYASNSRYVVRFSHDNIRLHFRQHFDINTMFAPSTLRNGLIRTQGDFDREDMFLSSGNSREQITWSLFLIVSVPEPTTYRLLINVVDINDNIPTFLSAMYHISGVEGDQQNANLNEYIIAARDTDQEHNAVQEYFLEDDLEGLFTLSVTLVGDIDTRFSVNEDVVRLESTRPLDREERASYNLVMIARDGGNMTGRLNINLTVLDVNDNDPVVAKTSYIVYIKENSTAIQHVIDINATDMDSGINGALTYSFSEITGDNEERVSGDIFSINASTGDVRTNAVLDREVDSSYRLIVQVKDRGSPPRSIFVTVDVEIYDNLDDGLINGATNCILQSGGNIKQIICNVTENVPKGTIVFNVTEIDSRYASNSRYVVRFSHDNIRLHFRQHFDINTMFAPSTLRNGLIRTQGDFDREDMFLSSGNSREQITWSLFLIVSVPEPTTYRLLINVVDINDNIPKFSSAMYHVSGVEGDQQNANLSEFLIAARDTDQKHNAVQEYFLEDDLEGLFTLGVTLVGDIDATFPVNEDVVRLESTRPLDREERASYNLVMVARDGGNMTGRLNINLTVLDVNDNDPVVAETSYTIYIKENSTAIQHVIDINATDMDSGINGALTYSFSEIKGSNSERASGDIFSINTSTGEIRTSAVFNCKTDSSFQLIVQIRDGGNPLRSVLVTVNVQVVDANGHPTDRLMNGATNCIKQCGGNIEHIVCNVSENVPEGTIVFNVTELDSRYASNLEYVVRGVHTNFRQHFDINTSYAPSTLRNGLIRTRGDFDREDMTSQYTSWQQITWSLFVIVFKPEPTIYRLHINVVDINDNVPTFSSAMYNVSGVEGDYQNTNLGVHLIAAKDTDQEHNAVQEYFLEDDFEGLFTLSVNLVAKIGRTSKDIVRLESTRPLDREERASYNLVMIARDGGNMTGRLNINLTVLDVNDNDPVVAETSYTIYIEENSTAIQHVIDINATDMDSGINGALTYSFSEIIGDNGERVSGDIFSINAITGEIKTSPVLDPETVTYYYLIVQVSDRGNPPRIILVIVIVCKAP